MNQNKYDRDPIVNNLGNAMAITDQLEADEFLLDYVVHVFQTNPNMSLEECKRVCKDNLGYYAGYYSFEVGERVEKLFGAIHPVLGTVEERKKLTADEIMQKGIEYAKQKKS